MPFSYEYLLLSTFNFYTTDSFDNPYTNIFKGSQFKDVFYYFLQSVADKQTCEVGAVPVLYNIESLYDEW